MPTINCNVCFRHCVLSEGQLGFCRARRNTDNKIVPENYGIVTSIALDPIEKKPLMRFFPGSRILSIGSYGCNLRCPFCQNHEISQIGGGSEGKRFSKASPEDILHIAERERANGNIGVAYTYNEALISYEFVRDTAALIHEAGMKNVLVSNGTAELPILNEILPFMDAMNIDLKSFSAETYDKLLCGNLKQTMEFIEAAAASCHMELTTLIVPGVNDSEEEIREMTEWIAGLNGGKGADIPYHISRFFPQFNMTDRAPTEPGLIFRLTDIARERLKYVYTGNI